MLICVLEMRADNDWFEDPIVVGEGHVVIQQTMQRIVEMADGSNGQRRRSHDSIERLYPWYRQYMLARFREQLSDGGSRLSKFRALDAAVLRIFSQASDRGQPVHGRMVQRWARQAANQTGLDDFIASDSWLYRFKRRNGVVAGKLQFSRVDQNLKIARRLQKALKLSSITTRT